MCENLAEDGNFCNNCVIKLFAEDMMLRNNKIPSEILNDIKNCNKHNLIVN